MDPRAQIENPSIGGHESRTIGEAIQMIQVGEHARVKFTKGADVSHLHISGNAIVDVEEAAHVSSVDLYDEATVNILPGADLGSIMGNGHSTINWSMGTLRLMLRDHSAVHIRENTGQYFLRYACKHERLGNAVRVLQSTFRRCR